MTNMDRGVKERVAETKKKIKKCIKEHVSLHGDEKAFEELYQYLRGFNKDDELFDFNFEEVCATITLRDGVLELCDECEVWEKESFLIDTAYEW